MGMIIILTAVMFSLLHPCVKMYQIIHLKYEQFIVHQLLLNKTVF